MLTHANRFLGRRLVLLVALMFVAIPMMADFAQARLPTLDDLGTAPAAVTSSNLVVAGWAEPSCGLSRANQVASAPCQIEKHTAHPPAAIESRTASCHLRLQGARLPAWHITLLDRPPNRLLV